MMEKRKLKVKILNDRLKEWGLPSGGSDEAAAVDLRACIDEPIEVKAGERVGISTGIAIAISDQSLCALILSRSGLGAVKGLTVAQGVGLIDSDYRGEIKVFLLNTSSGPLTIEPGERVAQMMLTPVVPFSFEEVSDLESSQRGEGGFGSSGSH
jgi:dUTP pyrophosphatase